MEIRLALPIMRETELYHVEPIELTKKRQNFVDRYKLLGERFISHGNIPGSFPKNPSHAAADTGFSDRRRW